MNIKWIEDLVCLLETSNFSRAAKLRCLTQSAFSRRIQALEEWCGVQLIDRSRYPITLTRAGQKLNGAFLEILNLSREIRSMSKDFRLAENSTLTIAIDLEIALPQELVDQIIDIAERGLQVVHIKSVNLSEGYEALEQGQVDILVCPCESLTKAPPSSRMESRFVEKISIHSVKPTPLSANDHNHASDSNHARRYREGHGTENSSESKNKVSNLAISHLSTYPSTDEIEERVTNLSRLLVTEKVVQRCEVCITLMRKRGQISKNHSHKTDAFWSAIKYWEQGRNE